MRREKTMTDDDRRDLFAAAALAGLLANDSSNGDKLTATCFYAYRIADRMLASTGRRKAEAAVEAAPTEPEKREPEATSRGDVNDLETEAWEWQDTTSPTVWELSFAPPRSGGIPLVRRTDAERVIARLTAEVERLRAEATLSEAEELAVAWAAREADEWDEDDTPEVSAHAEVLAGLFRRLTT